MAHFPYFFLYFEKHMTCFRASLNVALEWYRTFLTTRWCKALKVGNDRGPDPGRELDFFPGPCPGRGNQSNWPGPGATDCYFRVSFFNITLIFCTVFDVLNS